MFATRADEEAYRKEMNRMMHEAYEAQQAVIAAAKFTKLSVLIENGDRWSIHWRKMMADYGDIAVKYTTAYNSWGAMGGYVNRVWCEDGRQWRGTEGRTANGNTAAVFHLENAS